MDLHLAGRTVIVTGAGSNIGRAILLTFAREKANVVNAEIDEKQGQKVVDEANALGGHATLIKTDVTDWDSVQAMVKETLERYDKIEVLVNNVGGTRPRLFVKKSRDECEKEINLNYFSVVNCIKGVVHHMIRRNYGRIINIGSTTAQSGQEGYGVAVYGGTKGAVISLSKALAWELGRHGININVVCPHLTVPESLEHVGEMSGWRQWGWDFYTPKMQATVAKTGPLGRVGRPQDVANMVVFLASDCASYITGQTISVSGGMTMW